MKSLFFLILLFVSINSFGQCVIGVQTEYSKYKLGAGFFGGTNIGNSYVGLNTHVRFTNARNIPTGINAEYGYSIGKFQPFIMLGYETTGGEAVKENEGKQGAIYGGGISLLIKNVKIQAGILNNNEFVSVGIFGIL